MAVQIAVYEDVLSFDPLRREVGVRGGRVGPPQLLAPVPLTLLTVAPAPPTTVTLTWTFAGCSDSGRFELERQAATGEWRTLVVLHTPSARSWTGPPISSDVGLPFRVTAYAWTGTGASSNEKTMAYGDGDTRKQLHRSRGRLVHTESSRQRAASSALSITSSLPNTASSPLNVESSPTNTTSRTQEVPSRDHMGAHEL